MTRRIGLTLGIVAAVLLLAVLVGIVGLLYVRPATAQSSVGVPGTRQVTAIGHGEVAGQPDTATVQIGVETDAPTAKDALAQNSAQAQAIQQKLKELGVDEKDIQTSTFNINPTYTNDGRQPPVYQTDLPAVLALLRTCRALEDGDPWPSLHNVRQQLTMLPSGAAPLARLWEDRGGELLAFALFWDAEVLVFCVHPRAPRADLLAAILAWGRRRTQTCGQRAPLCVLLRADDRDCSAVLERQGFMPEPWSTLQMQHSLSIPIPTPQLPDGYTLRPLTHEEEIAAVAALHQEVFATSSGVGAERLAMMRDPEYLPDLDLVVVARDGTLAAFGLGAISYADDRYRGGKAGWIELVGTWPAFRRRGLGRAVLLTLLQRLKGYGMDSALVATTSGNAAAQRLFAALGFHTVERLR